MNNYDKKRKCYIYTRVSTISQIDGFSLDAQNQRLEDYANYRDLEIVGRYCDAGRSGASVSGRPDFMRMFDDIKACKDDISYVLVFKLSRFGRNTADVLKAVSYLEDNDIHLVSVEDAIDSSTSSGKFILTILSAVAEIEKDNIAIQFAEARRQSIREGNWYGGAIAYGYKKQGDTYVLNEEEASIVRKIFKLYVEDDYTIYGITKYLNQHGYTRESKNGNHVFTYEFVSGILRQSFYSGSIIYGLRGKDYLKTKSDDSLIIADSIYQPIITKEMFEKAQMKRERVKADLPKGNGEDEISIFSGLVKCPICGKGLISNVYRRKNNNTGGYYKSERPSCCRNHRTEQGKICSFSRYINQYTLDQAVFDKINHLDMQKDFIDIVNEQLGSKEQLKIAEDDYTKISKRKDRLIKKIDKIGTDMDNLDVTSVTYDDDYDKLSCKIEKLYDEYDQIEKQYINASNELEKIRDNAVCEDEIFDQIANFHKIIEKMTAKEKREYCRTLIDRIEIFEDKQQDGRLLKSISLRFPVKNKEQDDLIISINCANSELTQTEAKATYTQIKQYVNERFGLNVSSLYIGQVKTKYNMDKRKNYNKPKKQGVHVPQCPKDKEIAIVDAFKHFKMLSENVKVRI